MQIAFEPPLRLRARPSFRRVGIACTFFFSVMGTFSVWVAAFNVDGSFERPLWAAFAFALFWGAFVLLGVYLWCFSAKYLLEVNSEGITQRGVFGHKTVFFQDITLAKWRRWPSVGSLKIDSQNTSLAIDFDNIEREWRCTLIDLLHHVIPGSVQKEWERFQDHENKRGSAKKLSRQQTIWLFYLLAVPLLIAWFIGLGLGNLLVAMVNAGYATYLLFQKPSGPKL